MTYTTFVPQSFPSLSAISIFAGSTSATFTVISETLSTNMMTEKSIPIMIATVRSNITVAAIVIRYWNIAVFIFLPKMSFITANSFILHAVTISTPASAAIGIFDITPPSRNIDAKSTSECITPAILVCAPLFMATLVLAIAAVAGTPPKNGISILPMPCATSS